MLITKKIWKGHKKAKSQNREPTHSHLPKATANWQQSLVTEHVSPEASAWLCQALAAAPAPAPAGLRFLIWSGETVESTT